MTIFKPHFRRQWLVFLVALLPGLCFAESVSSFLEGVYQGRNQLHNVTKPQVVQGQQAGYLTGGSVVVRQPSSQLHPAHITLPKVSAGCQGIDIYTGGISFVNGDEFVRTLKDIIGGAQGYATMLALESLSPVVASVGSKIKGIADEVNRFNINSCETASLLVGAVAPKTQIAQQHACAQAANSRGALSDYVKAKHQCANPGALHAELNNAPIHRRLDVQFNVNLIWEALKKNGAVKANPSLSEWMMSLSGTKIYRQSRQGREPSVLLGSTFLAAPSESIHGLLKGGKVAGYRCDNTKQCLYPTKVTVDIPAASGLSARVDTLMQGISNSILSGRDLTQEQEQFISTVNFPVYKLIDLSTMTTSGDGYISRGGYADVIALDWLTSSAEQLVRELDVAAAELGAPSEDITPIRADLKQLLIRLNEARTQAFSAQGGQSHLLTLIHRIEQYRSAKVGSLFAHELKRRGDNT